MCRRGGENMPHGIIKLYPGRTKQPQTRWSITRILKATNIQRGLHLGLANNYIADHRLQLV